MNSFHEPVLLQEVLDGLRVRPEEEYIDATLGGGGHTSGILKLGGVVLGLDVDDEALKYVEKRFKKQISNSKLTLAKRNFRDIDKIVLEKNFVEVAGIIFDLGLSSHQINSPKRGFSFQKEGPLDMRMDQDLGVRALDLIKILSKGELNEIFTKFGEESHAWIISNAIVRARDLKEIKTTKNLVYVVKNELRRKGLKTREAEANCNRKIFQALRIAVNDELKTLDEALPKALQLLKKDGKLCVISFHSLEDRIVKKKFLEFEDKKMGKIITKKPIIPTQKEIRGNSRSGSAKLRIFEKINIV